MAGNAEMPRGSVDVSSLIGSKDALIEKSASSQCSADAWRFSGLQNYDLPTTCRLGIDVIHERVSAINDHGIVTVVQIELSGTRTLRIEPIESIPELGSIWSILTGLILVRLSVSRLRV
jgi:hypothetical protein